MKAKFKRIRSVKDIVAGQWYIRSVINCHGRTWLEVFKILGRPIAVDKVMKGYKIPRVDSGRILTKDTGRFSKPRLRYITDVMSSYRDIEGGLYRFSNSVYEHLKGMQSNRRALMDFNKGSPVTDAEVKKSVSHWEHLIYMDGQSDLESGHSLQSEEAYKRYLQDLRNDPSVSKFVYPEIEIKENQNEIAAT